MFLLVGLVHDWLAFPQNVNLAIPVKYHDSLNNTYWAHANNTIITKPVSFAESIREFASSKEDSYINKIYNQANFNKLGTFGIYHNMVETLEETVSYSSTIFSKFDNYLINQDHRQLNIY